MSHLPKLLLSIAIIGGALALSLFLSGKEINSLSSSILAPGATAIPITLVPTGTISPDVTESPMTTTEDPSWYTGPWSSCVSGKRTRIVECRDSSNTRVQDRICLSSKPDTEEVYSISGPMTLVSQETVGPVTYKVQLSKPNNSDAEIIDATIKAIPINRPAVNATHPQDGTGKTNPWMTWRRIEIGADFALFETTDHAWYGVPGGNRNPQLCYDSDIQSVYALTVDVQLNNGCILYAGSSRMQVQMEKSSGGTHARLFTIPEGTHITTVLPIEKKISTITLMKSLYENVLYKTCLQKVKTSLAADIENTMKGQYAKYAENEEKFHIQQFLGQVPYSLGGLEGLAEAYDDYFERHPVCAQSSNKEESIKNVLKDINTEIDALYDLMFTPKDKTETSKINNRCWAELTAKKASGITENIGGFDLECAYKICKKDMEQPPNPIDLINRL